MLGRNTLGDANLGGGAIATSAFSVNNVATSSPTVDAPTFSQTHALTANNVATASPTTTAKTFGQTQVLAANSVATVSPTTSAKTFGQTHVLAGVSIATASPAIGAATFAQQHALASTNVATASPAISAPTFGQTHALIGTNVATSSPSIAAASLTPTSQLASNNVATSAPTIALPNFAAGYTLNPYDKSITIALSADRLTANFTPNDAGGHSVRGTQARSTGLYYLETVLTTMVDIGVGFAKSTYSVDSLNYAGNTADSMAGYGSSYMAYNDPVQAGINRAAAPSGSLVCTAINFNTGQWWQRVGPTGAWNLGGAADPATGVGGQAFNVSNMIPAYPLLWFKSSNGTSTQSAVNNFGASTFQGAIPLGYTSWDGSQVGVTSTLVANNVSTASPTVGLPAFTQVNSLVANSFTTVAPSIPVPSFGQTHVLTATSISTSISTVGAAVFTQTHILAANSVATSAPSISATFVGQIQTLASTSVSPARPTFQSPAIAQTHALSAANLATAPPIVGVPVIAQKHVLGANGVTTISPIIAHPAFTQPQRINIHPIADVSQGGWINESGGSALYSSIDEDQPNDTDYIQSQLGPINSIARLKLEVPFGGADLPVIISYRFQKDESFQTGIADLTVRLMEGNTTIASWAHTNISNTLQGAMQTLTQTQFNAIVDQSNLYVELEASAS